MPFDDFREFLRALRDKGELVDVDRHVELYCEVGKNLRQAYFQNGPALQFNDNGTEFPLVANVYGNRAKAMIAFEATEATIFEKVLHGLDHPIPPKMYAGPAPCQEVVITGDDIDIRKFPIPQYSPKDGGHYITAGIVVSTSVTIAFFCSARTGCRVRSSPRTASARTSSSRAAAADGSRPRSYWAATRSSRTRARSKRPTRRTTGRSPAACAAHPSSS
jgi:hypothetical protein